MPKTTGSHAAKNYHALARAYDNIADKFKDGIKHEQSVHKLGAEYTAGHQIWQEV